MAKEKENKEKKVVDLDFGKIKTADKLTTWMTVKDPLTGLDTQVKLLLASNHSTYYREAVNVMKNRELAQAAVIKDLREAPTQEEIDEKTLELLVGCTLDWKGVKVNGVEVPFSKEAVKKLYKEHHWLSDAVDICISRKQAFFAD